MHPISSNEKRHQSSREGLTWSETVVRRRRAMARTESESETEAPPPPPFPPECFLSSRNSPQCPEKKGSNCSCQRSDSSFQKSRKSHTLVQEKVEKKTSDVTMQQLETKLYSAELENAMHIEKLEKMQKRLHRAAQLLEALALFTQSLDLQTRARARLAQLMGNLAYKDLNPSGTLVQTLDTITQDVSIFEKLNEVQSASSRANEIPEHLDQLLEELNEKRKNYMTASNSFSQYLRAGCHVSSNQLYKYEGQWDSLRSDYEHSKKLLQTEFSKLTDERHDVLEYCFSKLTPVQEKLVEQDDKFSILSKEITKSLRESQRHSCKNKIPQSQSSKTHRQS